MLIPVILTLVIGAPQVKPVDLASLRNESSLKTSDELISNLQSLGLEVSAAMTWIPTRDDFQGRRAFWIVGKDKKNAVTCEIGFIRWYASNPRENRAALLVHGGYFPSTLYAGMDYRIQQTVSQDWPRLGPNRWEVIIIARLGSPADEKSVKKRIMACFGESPGP